MSSTMLYRLAGVAAIVAGVLRRIEAFAFELLSSRDSERLFLVTDIVLLFALIGVYVYLSRAVGWAGLAGFAAAVVGIVLMRGAGDYIDAYAVGAGVNAVGVAVLGAAILFSRGISGIGPVLWIAALAVAILAYLLQSDWVYEAAGIAFGLGFVIAGVEMLRRPVAAA